MNRKVIITSIIFVIVCLFSSICFANTENMMDAAKNTTVNLKGEITNSIDKTQNSTRNITQDAMTTGGRMINGAGNMINNMTGNNNNNNNSNNNNMDNNTGYNTTRTAVDDAYFGTAGMDTTTWLWLILAIAAIIIVAAVWYYAMQETHIDEDK